jgi:hypothetical protein
MTRSDIEYLKSHIDQAVEIKTLKGERLLINVISVFDQESDLDVFFHDVSSNPLQKDFSNKAGHAMPLKEIVTVRKYSAKGARA